jgi:hypothetical protein
MNKCDIHPFILCPEGDASESLPLGCAYITTLSIRISDIPFLRLNGSPDRIFGGEVGLHHQEGCEKLVGYAMSIFLPKLFPPRHCKRKKGEPSSCLNNLTSDTFLVILTS